MTDVDPDFSVLSWRMVTFCFPDACQTAQVDRYLTVAIKLAISLSGT